MLVTYKNRQAELVLVQKSDGSRSVIQAYWLDGNMDDLTYDELDALQNSCDDTINENWRNE